MHSREEVVKGNYKDYQNATKKGKNKILARLVPECKDELRRRKALVNPVEFNSHLNEAVEKLLQINRDKIYTENTSAMDAA